jgi:uncharacterized protein YndB with AHSA1/START domain
MRFIKLGLISIVVLFLIITAISALIPSSVTITRTINIDAPIDSVYNNINDPNKWSRWLSNSDSAKFTITGSSVGKGSHVTIDYTGSTNKTDIDILESSPTEIKMLWHTGEAKPLTDDFYLITKPGTPVTLQWEFIQKVKWYPWEKFSLIFSDKAFGPFMEKSLDNLKQLLESPK